MPDVVLDWVTRWWDFIDNRAVIRRAVLLVTLWMTWQAFQWAAAYAATTKLDGLGAAAMIAAVTAPISVLQGFIFKVYSEGRA